MLRPLLLIAAIALSWGHSEAQETLTLRVLGYRVISQQGGTANCNFWSEQYGFTYGNCQAYSQRWVLNAVETDTTRYLLACRATLFGKCARLTDVGGIYEAETCGNDMCVHGTSGKHHKPRIIRYQIVESVLRR